ncbi:MFS transporter, partial [Pseudomonas aeruginosa]|nr:MFS transporter [Pseudomonas aeruginosa]
MPSSPSSLPSALVLLFAVACGLSVANVYYAQPLLDVLGAEFAIGQAGVGLLFGATQAGCALALLLVVPLGDLLERRRLMFVQLLLLVLSLLLVGFAGDTLGLALGLLGLGLLGTAMTQGLLAYAAALAAPGERGRVVGAAQGGVVIGLLLARSLAGLLADLGGWRSVYLVSAASMGGLGLLLWRVLPAAPSNELGLSYRQLLGSMFGLLASQRVLQVRGLLGLLMFAAFGVFWSSLVLLLSAPPYSLSQATVDELKRQTAAMAKALNVIGLMNVQFAIQQKGGEDIVYVLEVNPRASRTVPYVSKATGVPLAKVAARCMAGQSLESQG